MKFFVAKVNLKEKEKLGFQYLRPIQVAYETEKFMLPIRLGTVNAQGPQDMLVFMLSERGRVETTNYAPARIPTDINVPLFTKDEFGALYKAMFDEQVRTDVSPAVYLEYAWNMSWGCDPCSADPIPQQQLVELGASWLQPQPAPQPSPRRSGNGADPWANTPWANTWPNPQPAPQPEQWRPTGVFLTRLHVRYDAARFPEDLMFQETADMTNFQGRYILQHPFTGEPTCQAANVYRKALPNRFKREAGALSRLTGWDMAMISEKMAKTGQSLDGNPASVSPSRRPWYELMWEEKK
jgi:hypothetical protein